MCVRISGLRLCDSFGIRKSRPLSQKSEIDTRLPLYGSIDRYQGDQRVVSPAGVEHVKERRPCALAGLEPIDINLDRTLVENCGVTGNAIGLPGISNRHG